MTLGVRIYVCEQCNTVIETAEEFPDETPYVFCGETCFNEWAEENGMQKIGEFDPEPKPN